MSLYHEAASLIQSSANTSDSLKLRVFSRSEDLKSSPSQLYALLVETHRWNFIVKEIIEHSEILKYERRLRPELALVLVHDLLFSKKGIALPASHLLRASVEKHRVRLQAELTKLRIRHGYGSIEALRESLFSTSRGVEKARPRWIRINTLRTTWEKMRTTRFAGFTVADSLQAIMELKSDETSLKTIYVDEHVSNLIAVPAAMDVTKWPEYREGALILQDKASCFPAYMLNPTPDDYVIDACAAPGNKTTHLCALIGHSQAARTRVLACERDRTRSKILRHMLHVAGVGGLAEVRAEQDFLKLNPTDPSTCGEVWQQATCLLLDPSCSGSGIVGRDDKIAWHLPASKIASAQGSKKRKRHQNKSLNLNLDENEVIVHSDDPTSQARLKSLAAFQLKLILHAFTFPAARRVTYSTCSEYEEENEEVVLAALRSEVAQERGWSIEPRHRQVEGLRNWPLRGKKITADGTENIDAIADSCIRCSKSSAAGTQGFFVAAFERDTAARLGSYLKVNDKASPGLPSYQEGEKEWDGFSE